ncbi:MAG TPA: patatin-like phospholipase family protein [Thermoanaerobaculia bacterium]|jgi:predicted acylesterase/phospholipase RssA|nr:patatin-like phospholipase family protein [Thermoanaerobaculia bacterium]
MNGIEGLGPAPDCVEGFSPTPVDGFGPISVDGVGPAPDGGFGTTPWELLRGAKQVGFVFSGGGFRCAFQIGVVEALDELGIRPCLCSAVSAGAWNAAAVAVGNQRGMRRYWRTFMRMPHVDVTNLLREHSPFIFNEVHRRTFARYVGSDRLRSPRALPLLIGATRLWDRQFVVFDAREVENPLQLMLATNYLPPYYSHPPRLDGEIYVDGCWGNNLPYEAAFAAGCDAVVLMTMKAESEGRIHRNPRDPEHVIPSPYDRRVVVIRPRHRLPLGLIENNWPRMVEIIELGRRRTLEVLSAEHPAIEERSPVPLGPPGSGAPVIQA